jgi:branched-chain amino acid transport system ATP-binding protein
MLTVENIVTAYGMIQALRGVTLEARKGEITCLLGPNGAGKTTLMFTIAGLLKPQQGTVRLEGEDLSGVSAAKVVERGISLVPENRLMFPEMTVEENLMVGAFVRMKGKKADLAADKEAVYAHFPSLKERQSQLAGSLSGGEQQMVAIGRALMARPRILLMDEPSLGLAPLIVEEIFRIVEELNQAGVTIFLVEQNARMALRVAHHFYLLEQGRITFSGLPGELEEEEVFQRAYLGSRQE